MRPDLPERPRKERNNHRDSGTRRHPRDMRRPRQTATPESTPKTITQPSSRAEPYLREKSRYRSEKCEADQMNKNRASLAEIGRKAGTDKSSAHRDYLQFYEKFFSP